ncbi:hypothetical protein CF394_01975 [Tetzosporium hominis]|uniref:DUF881 domain-containing protein n=2 Tax=Tetzosporium hominis TaxID=2020506 RepID=A0A264W7A2_9BACL|nr:hypothetical protein CF394_01975 [Tetzosporium hominis]
MLAIQFNTMQSPEQRDTRDVWEIRKELSVETQYHSELLTRIREAEQLVQQYESSQADRPERLVEQSIKQLQQDIGLIPYEGPGVTITVTPSEEAIAFGLAIEPISPELLVRFVNEMNRFQAKAIEIDDKRLIYSSAIRDINGNTTINTLPIKTPPFEMKIATDSIETVEKLVAQIQASGLADDFYLENYMLEIGEPAEKLTITSYDQPIQVNYLTEWKEGD